VTILAGKNGWRPGLIIAGAAGAIVSVEETILRRALIETQPYLLIGLWFGLALAGYFAIIKGDRSIWKAVSLAGVSAGAYWLAFMATIVLELTLGHRADEAIRAHAMPLFVGGFVGAFVVSTTTFLLYGDAREWLPQRVLACSIAGGVLAAAGYQLGHALQFGVRAEGYSTSVLFVVWQIGLGLVMAVLWPARVPAVRAAPLT
jgi:hypothetical protein